MAGRPPGRKKREIKPIVDIDYEAMARKTLEQTQLYYRLFTGRLTEDELDKFYMWAPENVRKQFPRERFTNAFLAGMHNKDRMAAAVKSLPAEKKKEIESVTWKMADAAAIANCRLIFMEYVKRMWGKDFIPGHHFEVLAKCFEKCVEEGNKRYIINIAPRRGKSEFASYLFPSWYLGRRPKGKVIQVSNIKSLASDFGQKIRNLMATDDYETIFGNVTLNVDSKAKDKFNTNHGGSYFSVGAGGTITGRGADLLVIDDPHSERETIDGDMEPPTRDDFEKVWSWYNTIRPRLQPNGSIVVVMQRWSPYDLTGRLLDLAKKNPGADQWEVITLPALIEKRDSNGDILYDDKKEPIWESTWPQYWTTDMMLKMKANLFGIPNGRWRWECMYQQNVGAEEVSLVKRGSWKRWTKDKPPKCDFVIQSWDMATSDDARANYSACTTWGVFNVANPDDKPTYNIILLHAKRGQWKFHDLKTVVLNLYHRKDGVPDILLIEKKSAGVQVIQELQRMGIPVSSTTPQANRYTGKNDKYSRLNLVTSLFESGMVWSPETDWAEEVIDEVAEFPAGMYDDYVDSMTQALQRFRTGGFVQYATDEKDDADLTFDKRPVRYY